MSAAAGAVERIATIVTSIVRVGLLVKAVGPADYGTWLAILGMAQAGRMLNGGTHYALVNRFAEASLDPDRRETRAVLSTAFFLYAAIGLAGMSAGLALANLLPLDRWLVQPHAGAQVSRLLMMCVVWVFAAMPAGLFGTLLVGNQRQYVVSFWNASAATVQVVLLWAIVRAGSTSMMVFGGAIIATDLLSSYGLAAAVAMRTGLVPSRHSVDLTKVRRLFEDGFWFMTTDVGNWLKLGFPPLLIAAAAGPARLAEFAITLQLCQMCLGFITLIGTSLWPAYAESASSGDHRWLAEAFGRASALSIMIAGWTGGALLVCGDYVLRIWLHDRIPWNPGLAALLAVWVVGQSFAMGAWTFLAGVSRMKAMATITLIEGALVSLSAFALIRPFGAMGVAASMDVAVLTSAVFLIVTVRKVIGRISPFVLARAATLAIGTIATVFLVRLESGSGSPLLSLATGCLLTIVYGILIWYGVATADHRRRAQLAARTIVYGA